MENDTAMSMLRNRIWGEDIIYNIERTANNSLRKYGLTLMQAWVLLLLNDMNDKACSFKELERQLSVAQSTTAGIIRRLTQKGFVHCFYSSEDKRIKITQLTASGEECCDDTRRDIKELDNKLFENLSAEQKTELLHLLNIVYENVK